MAGANRKRYLLKVERSPPSNPLVISPHNTVTERSSKNESDVRNKMCKVELDSDAGCCLVGASRKMFGKFGASRKMFGKLKVKVL